MRIIIEDDFDLKKIVESGQCFRPKEVSSGVFRFISGSEVVHIEHKRENEYYVDCQERIWNDTWVSYFDLNTDYSKIRENIPQSDQFMRDAATVGVGIRILNQDAFEMLLSFIISQRKSIPAIRSSVEKICESYGERRETKYGEVRLFPTIDSFVKRGFDKLEECSLGYRLPYVIDSIERINAGEIDLRYANTLDNDDLLEYLMQIKGVGIKVASCVALFAYKRGDIAPVDVWINRVIKEQYNGINPFPGYGENSGIYQQYAFYAAR